MLKDLPQDVQSLMQWVWSDIEPYYNDLSARPLHDKNIEEWLSDWTSLDDRASEMYARLQVAITINTSDKDADARYKTFLDKIYPSVELAEQKLRHKLLKSGLEQQGFQVPLRKMRAEADLFREVNLPLLTQEHKLITQYQKIVGAQTIMWNGKERTISQLRPIFQNPERTIREDAWRRSLQRQLEDRQAINDIWKNLLSLRLRIAGNADKMDYRAFRWQQMFRFDYTPNDCRRFHDAIEQVVVPAVQRIYEKRRTRLGVKTLRPWDLDVDTFHRPPLKPFSNISELKSIASSIFHRVDPQLGDHYDLMVREDLLDLDNRKNKAPGGYCTSFPLSKRPFIFANSVGLHDDLQTLLHECGHAFHNFERYQLPYAPQRQVGMEFAEVASMSMELLASPYLSTSNGGTYTNLEAARAKAHHFEQCILFWPYMAVVDAFQHWVYEHPDAASDTVQCDEEWTRQWRRFMSPVDWSGLEQELMTGWQRKLHIHEAPLYYVEYGMAQLGAVQIWENARRNESRALENYRRALTLGGTVSLPELFSAAGAIFTTDVKTLSKTVNSLERAIEEMEAYA